MEWLRAQPDEKIAPDLKCKFIDADKKCQHDGKFKGYPCDVIHSSDSDCPKKCWKEYPGGPGKCPNVKGGDGPREAGYPTDYVTFHWTATSPHWDWVELEDGSWKWIGDGKYGMIEKGIIHGDEGEHDNTESQQ